MTSETRVRSAAAKSACVAEKSIGTSCLRGHLLDCAARDRHHGSPATCKIFHNSRSSEHSRRRALRGWVLKLPWIIEATGRKALVTGRVDT